MKKTIVLLTIVLAMLAAPVFAEVTASGQVDFRWAFSADGYSEKIDDNEAIINLGGTVGDYTSVTAEIKGDYGEDSGDIGANTDRTAVMNSLTLTQDITGALGIDSPVSVAYTVGVDGMGDDPVNYNEIAGYNMSSDGEVAEDNTIKSMLSFGVDTITIDAAVWEDNIFGINAYGTVADMADVSVYYYSKAATGWEGQLAATESAVEAMMIAGGFITQAEADATALSATDAYVYGANFAMDVADGVKVGAGMETLAWDKMMWGAIDTESDITSFTQFGVSATYTMDALTAGLSVYGMYFEDTDEMEYKMAENTMVGANVCYSVSDMLDVFAGVKSVIDAGDEDFSDVVCYEAGAKAMVDGVTYMAGYTVDSDMNAYIVNDPEADTRDGNFFMRVKASF